MNSGKAALSSSRRSGSSGRKTGEICLEVVGGSLDGLLCYCSRGPAKIGRSSSCHLPLVLDKHASGSHALVGHENDRYWLEDPKSKNGTWLDGNEIPRNTKVRINPGKIFVIGNTAVELLHPEDASHATTPVDVQARVEERLEKLSPSSRRVMTIAEEESRARGSECIDVRHVFLGLCNLEDRNLARLFEKFGLDRNALRNDVREVVLWSGDDEWVKSTIIRFTDEQEPEAKETKPFTPRVAMVLNEAMELCRAQGLTTIEPLCLLYGILVEGRSIPAVVLKQMDKDTQAMAEEARTALVDRTEPLLSRIGKDLTALARDGKLEPFVGRDDDMEKLTDIPSRPSKNNALIVGVAGIGKTTLVRGLAQETAQPNCAKGIRGKIVVEIPMSELTARVTSAKELEGRLLELTKSARQTEDTILFFDNIHLLFSAKQGGKSANIRPGALGDAFEGDDVWCVATTTVEGFEKFFKDEPALERSFEVVQLAEMSEETATSVLRYMKGVFESRYEVRISDDAVSQAVGLTAEHVTDQWLPAKAIRALDEACSSAKSHKAEQLVESTSQPLEVDWEDVARVVSGWTGLTVRELLGGGSATSSREESQPKTAIATLLPQHGDWLMAREMSDRIDSLQSEYHLADVWDRRAALKDLIGSELGKMAPERRQFVADNLREMFPVAEGDPQLTDEVEHLRSQLAQLRGELSERPNTIQCAGAIEEALLGHEIGDEEDTGSDAAVLKAVRELFLFARNTEKVTKAFLEALVAQGGSESTQFDLPHWTRDLDRLVDEIAKGKNEESLDKLRDYLSDLNCWLMACLTGYQQAAPQWSIDFLDRSSPKSIEKGAKLPDWKKHLGLASSELWERYNEMIQDLTPGLVEDEVRDIAAKIAKEHYRNLKGKSMRRSK